MINWNPSFKVPQSAELLTQIPPQCIATVVFSYKKVWLYLPWMVCRDDPCVYKKCWECLISAFGYDTVEVETCGSGDYHGKGA